MRLLRTVLIIDLTAGVLGFLLNLASSHVTGMQIVAQAARSLSHAFFVGTLIVLLLSGFGTKLYALPFPLNWTLILSSILVCTFTGNLAYNSAAVVVGDIGASQFWSAYWADLQFSTILALSVGIGAFGYRLLRNELDATTLQLRSRELEEERARKLAAEAQLASLESHVRPHFLFNTLNTISSLIPEDPSLAESLVGKLAALLRFSLDSSQQRLTPLERELKIVRDYLEIERARYGERLRFRIDAPLELRSVQVPALSIQTLVENSVKYAVAARLEGSEVRVRARALEAQVLIEVTDNGPGFTAQHIRTGHGIDNLQSRLGVLFGPEAKLEISNDPGGAVVSFCVPRTALPREAARTG